MPPSTNDKENDMLQQIIIKTPVWVWALLAFLVYRGLVASVDRVSSLRATFLIPLVMLGLSVQGIATTFATDALAMPVWFAALLAGTALTWSLVDPSRISADPAKGTIRQPGSWIPLMLMMGIFLTKYAVAIMLAVHPEFKQQAMFVASVCTLYGLFNGIFLGRLLRIVAVYRGSMQGLPA
jgi:hypothetical protein